MSEDYDYRHIHRGCIGERPIDRYSTFFARVDVRRLSNAEFDEISLIRKERVVITMSDIKV